MMSPQQWIAESLEQRGYGLGRWKPQTFIARQLVKILEESAELFLSVTWTHPKLISLAQCVMIVQHQAKDIFDDTRLWDRTPPYSDLSPHFDAISGEVADVGVVASAIAEALPGSPDLITMALRKAKADEGRGVR